MVGELITLGLSMRWSICLRFQHRWGAGAFREPRGVIVSHLAKSKGL